VPSAFRFVMVILGVMIFVTLPDQEINQRKSSRLETG
jgi:predicted small integral membrane protein